MLHDGLHLHSLPNLERNPELPRNPVTVPTTPGYAEPKTPSAVPQKYQPNDGIPFLVIAGVHLELLTVSVSPACWGFALGRKFF